MRVILLLLLFLLPSWVCAADGEEFNSLVGISDEDALMFAKAICESEQDCRFGEDEEPYGPFVEFSKGYFWFYKLIYGKFSQGEIPEAFIHVLGGSESEFYGNGTLFRYRNNTWQFVAWGDAPSGNCGKFVGNASKEILVCYTDFHTHITDPYLFDQSEGSGFVIIFLSFTRKLFRKMNLSALGTTF
jgi:hypothetical protein